MATLPHVSANVPDPSAKPTSPSAPLWLIDEAQQGAFKHYITQFITAHCPACNSRKVFVDGTEQAATVDEQASLLVAYFAVCDECNNVWCRAASPDEVAARCIKQTAAQDGAAKPALQDFSRQELFEINDALNEVIHRMCLQGQTPQEMDYHSLSKMWSALRKLTEQLLGPGLTPGLEQLSPLVQANIATPRPLRAKRAQD
jgi:predicted metal-binding protein